MRCAAIVQSCSLAVLVTALLVACGGGGSELVPAADEPTSAAGQAKPTALPSEIGVAPTPVAPASPISVPTPVATSSSSTGLPTAAPASVSSKHRHSSPI
jgi:hypothetical protein